MQIAEQQVQQAIEFTYQLARVNSGSTNIKGVKIVQQMLAERLEALGLDCNFWSPDDATAAPVLEACLNPDASQRILLMGHADTVFPENSSFQKIEPLDDNRVRGPGLADMKGGLAVMLAALENSLPYFAQHNIGIDVLVNGDEETGSINSRPVIEQRARSAFAAFAYEPVMSSGELAGQRAASGNITYLFEGLSAHAGRDFHAGRNAVSAAAALAVEVEKIWRLHDGVTLNNAALIGGDTFNTVPDQASLRINGRSRDQDMLEQALAAVEQAAQHIAATSGVTITHTGGIHRPAKSRGHRQTVLEGQVTSVGAEQGLNIQFKDTNGVCDGNIIAHVGTPVVDTMGVRGGLIHTADEFVELDSFAERIALNSAVFQSFTPTTIAEVSA